MSMSRVDTAYKNLGSVLSLPTYTVYFVEAVIRENADSPVATGSAFTKVGAWSIRQAGPIDE